MSCQPVSIFSAKISVPKEAPKIGAVTGIIGDGGMILNHVAAAHILTHHVLSPLRRYQTDCVLYDAILELKNAKVNGEL